MKTRFTAADCRAIVRDLRSSVLGLRLVNVYDLDAKTYLFKLANPGEGEKRMLLMESGVRFHTTRFARDKNDMPSGFSMKLRKHIRAKRLEDVRQIGTDRVIDFKFGAGDGAFHVLLELYASGNIILTDHNYEILNLLRTHTYEDNVSVAVRQVYPVTVATNLEGSASGGGIDVFAEDGGERLAVWMEAEAAAIQQEVDGAAAADGAAETPQGLPVPPPPPPNPQRKGKGAQAAKRAKKKLTLRQLLVRKGSGVGYFGPALIEHCLLAAGLNPASKEVPTRQECDALVVTLKEAPLLVDALDQPGQAGYVLFRRLPEVAGGGRAAASSGDASAPLNGAGSAGADMKDSEAAQVAYEEFLPHLLRQHPPDLIRSFPSFDEAVDEYFGRIEEQKMFQTASAADTAADNKVERIRADQQQRQEALAAKQGTMLQQALALEAAADDVEKALTVVRSAMANGVGWRELDALVAAETAAGNPIAALIARLDLNGGRVVLRLPSAGGKREKPDVSDGESEKSEDSEDSGTESLPETLEIEVDYALSAHANARELYDLKKRAREKELKTLEASEQSLKVAEKAAAKNTQRQQAKRTLAVARKVLWFEKFNWFITSDNYLVLSGRDAQQNELLVKRYLRPCDIYVHADLHGASSCVVRSKDPTGARPISETALLEAGCTTVCHSAAWAAKTITSAWWVYADQVSKTAPSGEYLVTGSFMVRGKKNFLPPPRALEMGFAVLFKLDEDSVRNHLNERRERRAEEDEDDNGGAAATGSALRPFAGLEVVRPQPRPVQQQQQQQQRKLVDGAADAPPSQASQTASRQEGVGLPAAQANGRSAEEGETGAGAEGGALSGGGDAARGGDVLQDASREEERERGGGSGRKLSAKDRRVLKKGKAPGGAGGGGGGGGRNGEEAATAAAQRSRDAAEGGGRGASKGNAAEGSDAGRPTNAAAAASEAGNRRGKHGKLKKLKKYAEQDEEDRLLALQALGHIKPAPAEPVLNGGDAAGGASSSGGGGGGAGATSAVAKALAALRGDVGAAVEALPVPVRERLGALEEEKVLKLSEMDAFELQALGKLPEEGALEVLDLFASADLRKVRNKSGFLAGVMRGYGERLAKKQQADAAEEAAAAKAAAAAAAAAGQESDGAIAPVDGEGEGRVSGDDGSSASAESETEMGAADLDGDRGGGNNGAALSRRAQKKKDEEDLRRLLEEEGAAGGDGGGANGAEEELADELTRLTGQPLPDDVLLHALPVCAPYQSIAKYKYKVKLTPGTLKRGKAAKQALEAFARTRDSAQRERDLIAAMPDTEAVAAILGGVKLVFPQQVKQQMKKSKK